MERLEIRQAVPADYDWILDVNEKNVEVLAPMDIDKLKLFAEKMADMLLVIEEEGEKAAFLIALREGCSLYDSENYRWFCDKYEKFLYIDRIVIAEGFRGRGIGREIYRYVFDYARANGVSFVTAEIDTIPYNGPSLKFHDAMGFREVGTQYVRNGAVRVSLQEAAL